MILQNIEDMTYTSRDECDERTSLTTGVRSNPCCAGCCKIFWISFFLTGFLLLFIIGICLYVSGQSTPLYIALFMLSSAMCLVAVFVLICRKASRRKHRLSRQPSIDEIMVYFVSKTRSDGALINIPGRAESTRSLPCLVLLQAAPGLMVEKSTEPTVSEEESRETLDEEAAGSSKENVNVTPLAGGELGEAKETIVKVVDETLHGRGGAEAASEGSSEPSAETQKVVQPGVRQRRQTPMESQKFVPEPEGEKTD